MSNKGFKIVSVLFIISGIFTLIGIIPEVISMSTPLALVAASAVLGILETVLGFLGLKVLKDDANASLCVKLNLVLIIVTVVYTVASCMNPALMAGTEIEMNAGIMIATVLISLILPVLYMLGAKRLAN